MKLRLFLFIALAAFLTNCEKEEPFITDQIDAIEQEIDFRSGFDGGIYKIMLPNAKYLEFSTDGTFIEVKKVGVNWIEFGTFNGVWEEDYVGHLLIDGLYQVQTGWHLWVGNHYELDGRLMKPLIFIE